MFSMLDPREFTNFPPVKELNDDINLLSKSLAKGALNDKEVLDLTALIKKIGDKTNKPLFSDTQSKKFSKLIKVLEIKYPSVYEKVKVALKNDTYIQTTYFGEPAPKFPSPPISNPSVAPAQATTTQTTVTLSAPILAPAPFVFPADKAAMAAKIIDEGKLDKLQELCMQIDPKLLLLKAFEMGNSSVCRWLVKNPAIDKKTLDALPQQKPEQQALQKWLLTFVEIGPVTPVTLKKLAMEQGYGFKSGNLMVLKAMGEDLNKAVDSKGAPVLTKCQIKVPSFVPVSNFEVTQHILKHDPGLVELWEKCKKSFKENQVKAFLASQKPASEQMDVTDEGRELLKQIGGRLEALFQNHPLNTPEMQEWLQTNEGKPIIVRSTGKEDSDELANAGGNESIPFVKPDIASLNHAMGRVIGSYFCDPTTKEPRSIQQRLAAGDKTIFTEAPFMPVLLQQMVMEDPKDPKTMLRSGVLFSRPQADFTDAVLIQTGLGNNHGVVTSEVAVDTYTVENHRVQAVVRDKSTRFVHAQNPNGGFSLQLLPNDRTVATTQALSEGAVKDLAKTATHIASIYGGGNKKKSMDMEYSIQVDPKTGKQTIYLLQARPLMDTEGGVKQPKTYLDLKTLHDVSKRNSEDTVKGKTLLDGNSHVRNVTSSKQVLMADELATALQMYLSSPDRKDIKAIIIKRKAVLTSHEAVTLRPMGVPVIIIDNATEFEKARRVLGNSSEAFPTLLCPQRAVIVGTKNVPAGVKIGFVKKGLVAFPGALETSVPVNKQLAKAMKTRDKKEMDNYLKGMEARYQFIMHKLSKIGKLPAVKGKDDLSLKQMLDLVATGDKAQAGSALGGLLKALHAEVGAILKTGGDKAPAGSALSKLMNAFSKAPPPKQGEKEQTNPMAAYEMLAAFSAILEQVDHRILPSLSKTQPSSMERLYHLKPLDALIFQTASTEVVNGFSFRSALTMQATTKMLEATAKSAGQMRPEATALILHYKNALSREFGNKWMLFIQNLEKTSPKSVDELYVMVKTLDELQMTSLAMGISSTAFDPSKPVEAFDLLKQGYDANLQTLQWLKTESQTVEHLEQAADQWGDPAFFDKQIASLTKTYNNWFGPANNCLIKQKYDAAGPLGKLATLQFLGRTVNAFDHIIKAVKGSDHYKDDKKLKLFAQLLKTYHQMMEQTFTLVPAHLEQSLMKLILYPYLNFLFKEYTSHLRDGKFHCKYPTPGFTAVCAEVDAGTTTAAEQFVSRGDFNVASLTIGSKSYMPDVNWPRSLEEYFTTFHQNMEVAKNALSCTLGLGKEVLTPRAQEMAGLIEKKFGTTISTINFKDGKVEVDFNIPLREHASTIRLVYDPMDPEERLEIGVMAYGNDEHDRWDLLAGGLAVMSQSQPGITMTQTPKINYKAPRGIEAYLGIKKTFKDTSKLVDELYYLIRTMTFDEYSTSKSVLAELKANNFYSPDKLTNQALLHAPGMLNTIMQTSLESNNTPLALKAALGAIIGTAQRETDDYTNRYIYAPGSQFTHDYTFPTGPGYPVVGSNYLVSNNALRCLLELLDQMKISPIDLEPLFADKSVQKIYPKLVSDLKDALKYYSSAKDKIPLLLAANKPLEAIQLLKFVVGGPEKTTCTAQIGAKFMEEKNSPVFKDHLIRQCCFATPAMKKEIINILKLTKNAILNPLLSQIMLYDQMQIIKNGPKTILDTKPLLELLTNDIADKKIFKNSADYIFSRFVLKDTSEEMNVSDIVLTNNLINKKIDAQPLIPFTYHIGHQSNGISLALLGFIEGLKSKDVAIRAEAAAQIKALKAQIVQADALNDIMGVGYDPTKPWKEAIDNIIKHYKL